MSDSFDVEEFVARYTGGTPKRRPAAEIMMAPIPSRVGPRLDYRRGRKRWVTLLDRKPKKKNFTLDLPML